MLPLWPGLRCGAEEPRAEADADLAWFQNPATLISLRAIGENRELLNGVMQRSAERSSDVP